MNELNTLDNGRGQTIPEHLGLTNTRQRCYWWPEPPHMYPCSRYFRKTSCLCMCVCLCLFVQICWWWSNTSTQGVIKPYVSWFWCSSMPKPQVKTWNHRKAPVLYHMASIDGAKDVELILFPYWSKFKYLHRSSCTWLPVDIFTFLFT